MGNEKNLELSDKLKKAYIGGHSNLKFDLSVTPMKIFVDRMEGARVWDLDGNEYVDYMCALGPIIIGHCHPQYVRGMKDTLDKMSPTIGSYVLATEMEIELAEKLKQHIPCAEEIKFVVTGSEAVQLAIRLARAQTEKRYVITFAGHYHGWFDNIIGQLLDPNPKGMPFGIDSPKDYYGTQGKDPEAAKQTFILPGVECEVAYTDEDMAALDMRLLVKLQKTLQSEWVITRSGGTFYFTAVHNDADIDFTLEAFSRTMAKL